MDTAVSSGVVAESSAAVGGWLTALTVMVRVALAWAAPSLIV